MEQVSIRALSASPRTETTCGQTEASAEFDVLHRFVASYVWELPFGRGRRIGNDWNTAVDLLLGGWQVTGIHPFQTGLGLTATLGGASVLNIGGERRARPNLIGDPVLPESERTLERWFNTAAFSPAFVPAPQAFGTAGVGIMRGTGIHQFRLYLSQELSHIREAVLPVPDRVLQCVQSR